MTRCRFVQPDIVRLSLSDGDWIDVKKALDAGDTRRLFTDLVVEFRSGEKAKLDPKQVGVAKILIYVVAWSLRDAANKPVAVTIDALNALTPDDYREIADAVEAHDVASEAERTERKNERDGAMRSAAILPSVA